MIDPLRPFSLSQVTRGALPLSSRTPSADQESPVMADSSEIRGLEPLQTPKDAVKTLAESFGYAEFPQVSPDGEKVIFNVVGDYTTSQMLEMDLKGKHIRSLFTGEPVTRESLPAFLEKHRGKIDEQGTWSQDGRHIFYRSNEKGTFGIGRFDTKTSSRELVLHDPGQNLKHPVETHEGFIIGYGGPPSEKYLTSEKYSNIFIGDPAGHTYHFITDSEGAAAYKHPSEMKGVIVAHKEMKGPAEATSDLITIDPATGKEMNLTKTPDSDERHPFYHKKRDLIAFHSDESGDKNLWLATPDGSRRCQLTFYGKAAQSPCWTPDGKKIVFVKKLESIPEGEPFYHREADIRVIDVKDALKDLAHQAKKRLKSAEKHGAGSEALEQARAERDTYKFFLKRFE
ncbi:MAG: hypothetical protein RDV48_29345 [Candidatus Eremiobacteraeota bacterium]|nr:hypothetical protein [Candidatus Eremiobacteraeota bacterium]